MELMEGLQIIKEMCKQAPVTCEGCLLDTRCPFAFNPHEWYDDDTKHIAAAAEEWKEKHKQKTTMLEVLKERLPNVRLNDAGRPDACPSFFFGDETPNLCGFGAIVRCDDCWNRPAPEMYQTKEE